MIHLHFDALNHEWVIQYAIDQQCQQTIRTSDNWAMQKYLQQFISLEKGVANGKKFYTVPQ